MREGSVRAAGHKLSLLFRMSGATQAAMALRAVKGGQPSGLLALPARARRPEARARGLTTRAELFQLESNPLLTAKYPTGEHASGLVTLLPF